MRNIRQIGEELELMSTLKLITQAYEEISVMRMQRVRNSVINTRTFLDELATVFADVKENYRSQFLLFTKEKDPDALLKLNKNGREAVLLISSNAKMNGEIVTKVFREFVHYIEEHECDVFILGKLGKQMLQQHGTQKQYKLFDLDENNITADALRQLILDLVPYKNVTAFYGKFESLMFQEVINDVLTGSIAKVEKTDNKYLQGKGTEKSQLSTAGTGTADEAEKQKIAGQEEIARFIFEPSIEIILQFFETQIFSSLLKQSVHESELARYASRIRAMEEAGQHIQKTKKSIFSQRRKLRNIIQNRKQLEVVNHVQMIH